MVIGLALTLALLAALVASGLRLRRRRRKAAALAALPGGSRATALVVEDFRAMDRHLANRDCLCGGALAVLGERSLNDDGRVLRVVRVECRRCEELGEVWFDASQAYH